MSNFLGLSETIETISAPSNATASTTGIVRLTNDFAGTATAPTVVTLTGAAGVVTCNSQLQSTTLANNSATVAKGELLSVSKTISIVKGSIGNVDTVVWQTPAKFRLLSCFLEFTSSVTLAALTTALLSLGSTTGGIELMAAYTLLGTEVSTTAPVGVTTTQLGTDLISGGNFQKTYMSATNISFRHSVVAGSITTGDVKVHILGYQF